MKRLTAVILAGGYGKRLWPLTKTTPKPLLPLGKGKVILDFVIEKVLELKEVQHIVLSTNLKFKRQFENWVKKYPQAKIELVVEQSTREEEKPGALKALHDIISRRSSDYLVLAGDNVFTSSLRGLIERYEAVGDAVIAVYDVKDAELAKLYGVVEAAPDGRITGFEEKPDNPRSTLVSTGIYVFPEKIIPLMSEYLRETGKRDRLGDFIQWLHRRTFVYAYPLQGEWWDIGSVEAYRRALENLGKTKFSWDLLSL